MEEENINIPAWFSFNSKDGVNVVSGDSFLECVSIAESCKKVVAMGINCTPPRFIHGLISSITKVLSLVHNSFFDKIVNFPSVVTPNQDEEDEEKSSSFSLLALLIDMLYLVVRIKIAKGKKVVLKSFSCQHLCFHCQFSLS